MATKSIEEIKRENEELLRQIEMAEQELKVMKEEEKRRRRRRRKKVRQVLCLRHDTNVLQEALDKLETTQKALGTPEAWSLQQVYDLEYQMAHVRYLAKIAGFPPSCTLYITPEKEGPQAEERRNALFQELRLKL